MGMGKPKFGWHGVRKRPNGKYQARWCVDDNGTLRSEMFLGKEQASTFATRKANEVLDVKVGLAVVRIPILEARDLFLNRRTKANTRALNERRVDEFLTALPKIKDTSLLTNHVINQYARLLEDDGHNPGGQNHHLKIVRAFTNFCLANKWLTSNPFEDFVMPKSTYEGRALTADERALMYSIEPRYVEVDTQLNSAFRFGYSTMLRISQVWALTPADFREPNMMRISGIKDQNTVTILLEDEAVQVLKKMPIRAQHERYFSHWASVDAMRNSVEDKARRMGLPGVRFHDVCKVSKVSDLDAEGIGLGDLAHLSNTSKATLAKHYIKSDRNRAFANYIARSKKNGAVSNPGPELGQPRANSGPTSGGFVGSKEVQPALEGSISTSENASTSPQILTD
jgi:integrase